MVFVFVFVLFQVWNVRADAASTLTWFAVGLVGLGWEVDRYACGSYFMHNIQ
ncbi:hypothetical protein M758_9G121500 [Ceratodon purpureus]|nr:hypothetical protein M758_9G121500 [Ceratodon purpureus]